MCFKRVIVRAKRERQAASKAADLHGQGPRCTVGGLGRLLEGLCPAWPSTKGGTQQLCPAWPWCPRPQVCQAALPDPGSEAKPQAVYVETQVLNTHR